MNGGVKARNLTSLKMDYAMGVLLQQEAALGTQQIFFLSVVQGEAW